MKKRYISYDFAIICTEDIEGFKYVLGFANGIRGNVFWHYSLDFNDVHIDEGMVDIEDFTDELRAYIIANKSDIDSGKYDDYDAREDELVYELVLREKGHK